MTCKPSVDVVCAHASAAHPSAWVGLFVMLALLAPTLAIGLVILRSQRGLSSDDPATSTPSLAMYETPILPSYVGLLSAATYEGIGTAGIVYEAPAGYAPMGEPSTYEAPDMPVMIGAAMGPDSAYADLLMCQACESPLAPWHWREDAWLGDGGSCECATPCAPISVSPDARHWFVRTPSAPIPPTPIGEAPLAVIGRDFSMRERVQTLDRGMHTWAPDGRAVMQDSEGCERLLSVGTVYSDPSTGELYEPMASDVDGWWRFTSTAHLTNGYGGDPIEILTRAGECPSAWPADTGMTHGPAVVFGVTDRTGRPYPCCLPERTNR